MASSKPSKRKVRWMYRKYPLFAHQFIDELFGNYDIHQLDRDVAGMKPKKRKSKRKKVLSRYGRYAVMQKRLAQYQITNNLKYLREAQQLRNKLTEQYTIRYKLDGEEYDWVFPATYRYSTIVKLAQIKFNSYEELQDKIHHITKWAHVG